MKTVHRLWPNEALPGELAQVLPTPAHFEQAAELVTEEMIARDGPVRARTSTGTSPRSRSSPTRASTSSTCSRSARASEEFFDVLGRDVLPRFG